MKCPFCENEHARLYRAKGGATICRECILFLDAVVREELRQEGIATTEVLSLGYKSAEEIAEVMKAYGIDYDDEK